MPTHPVSFDLDLSQMVATARRRADFFAEAGEARKLCGFPPEAYIHLLDLSIEYRDLQIRAIKTKIKRMDLV
jgi:hypothetical protein